jgi:hypothetical protein
LRRSFITLANLWKELAAELESDQAFLNAMSEFEFSPQACEPYEVFALCFDSSLLGGLVFAPWLRAPTLSLSDALSPTVTPNGRRRDNEHCRRQLMDVVNMTLSRPPEPCRGERPHPARHRDSERLHGPWRLQD